MLEIVPMPMPDLDSSPLPDLKSLVRLSRESRNFTQQVRKTETDADRMSWTVSAAGLEGGWACWDSSYLLTIWACQQLDHVTPVQRL